VGIFNWITDTFIERPSQHRDDSLRSLAEVYKALDPTGEYKLPLGIEFPRQAFDRDYEIRSLDEVFGDLGRDKPSLFPLILDMDGSNIIVFDYERKYLNKKS